MGGGILEINLIVCKKDSAAFSCCRQAAVIVSLKTAVGALNNTCQHIAFCYNGIVASLCLEWLIFFLKTRRDASVEKPPLIQTIYSKRIFKLHCIFFTSQPVHPSRLKVQRWRAMVSFRWRFSSSLSQKIARIRCFSVDLNTVADGCSRIACFTCRKPTSCIQRSVSIFTFLAPP